MRNRLTGRWLSDLSTPDWSDDKDGAFTFPSMGEARRGIRTVGLGPVPLVYEKA